MDGGEVNDTAMHALIKMEATCILPRLIAELSHPEEYVRWRAAYGLEKIGDARALPELDRVAQDAQGNTRRDISVTGMAQQAAARIRHRMMDG